MLQCATAVLLTFVAIAAQALSAHAQVADPRLAEPEAATGRAVKPPVIAYRHLIVAANPLAAKCRVWVRRSKRNRGFFRRQKRG